MASRRRNNYTLYGMGVKGGPISNKSARCHSGGLDWIYEVRAVSIKQAYYLAGDLVFATGPGDTGIRQLTWRDGGGYEGGRGGHVYAKYLEQEGSVSTLPTESQYRR